MPYLKSFSCGPYETNAFLVAAENSQKTILIDTPPFSFDEIMDTVKNDGRSLEVILITHPHLDHTWDAPLFANQGIPVLSLKEAAPLIKNPQPLEGLPVAIEDVPKFEVDQTFVSGDVLDFAGLKLKVLEVPGHCRGSVAFLVLEHQICFVGDLIFNNSVGRTDLEGGSFDQLAESIQTEIYTLSNNTILYAGHGPSTEVGKEKLSNPFVRG